MVVCLRESRGRQALGRVVRGSALNALGRALSGRSPFRVGTPSGQEPTGIESRGHGRASPSGLVLPTLPCPIRCASEGENCRQRRNVRTEYQAGSSGWDSGREPDSIREWRRLPRRQESAVRTDDAASPAVPSGDFREPELDEAGCGW